MGQEIERKFLVTGEEWRNGYCTTIRQGYLSRDKARTVRVRTKTDVATSVVHAYLTIKGISTGAARAEYEYELPVADADELLDQLCLRPLIEKHRYTLLYDGMRWEVDEFFGENQGLVVAEIELEEANQSFTSPSWLGKEVTDDPRYFNAALSQRPYSQWEG